MLAAILCMLPPLRCEKSARTTTHRSPTIAELVRLRDAPPTTHPLSMSRLANLPKSADRSTDIMRVQGIQGLCEQTEVR